MAPEKKKKKFNLLPLLHMEFARPIPSQLSLGFLRVVIKIKPIVFSVCFFWFHFQGALTITIQ
jgi:hypothetical protein